jgi:hypothetical protein
MMDKERLYSLLNNKSHKCYGTENLILDTKLVKELNGIIKKLNDEVDVLVEKVDALTKQKNTYKVSYVKNTELILHLKKILKR